MFNEIVNSLNIPIIVLDKDNFIRFVNPAVEEFLSLSSGILINNNLINFFNEDSALFLLIKRVRKTNNSLSEDSLTLNSKNNLEKKVKISIFPLFNIKNHIIVQLIETKSSEKFISHKIHNKISKSFSNMVSMLMHELKNPLAGIIGASQLIEKDIDKKDLLKFTNLIITEANRINKLLLSMETISVNDGYLPSKLINIHEVLTHCKDVVKNSFGMNIKFKEIYDPSLPEIYGNQNLLIQIFLNLFKNSCEAQVDKGEIVVKTSFNTNKLVALNSNDMPEIMPIQVEIIDNGMGIDGEILNNIFDPFLTTKKNGTGLGLSIVLSGLNAMGASIDVSSKKGETNFCINFPLRNS